jgi:hypothetical protein
VREKYNKVNMLLSVGWSNDRIASAILDPRLGKSIFAPALKRPFRSGGQVSGNDADAVRATAFGGARGGLAESQIVMSIDVIGPKPPLGRPKTVHAKQTFVLMRELFR